MRKIAVRYAAPECGLSQALWSDLLCTSPEFGGNEDVVYEDWVTNG